MRSNWKRVSKQQHCPICGRPDWCLIAKDGSAAVCKRVQSELVLGQRDAGWIHRLNGRSGGLQLPKVTASEKRKGSIREWEGLARFFSNAIQADQVRKLAFDLGVTVNSLVKIRIGWAARHRSYTFPILDWSGKCVGIRTRSEDGCSKKSIYGSDGNGLFFVPRSLGSQYLLICEGPTDTASLVDCGFASSIGLPSCSGGTDNAIRLVKHLEPESLLLIPDNDTAGRTGFERLANALLKSRAITLDRIDICIPPDGCKDIREWKQKNREDLAGTIAAKLDGIIQRREAVE